MEELVRQRINEVLVFFKANPTQISRGDSALQVRLSRQLSQGAAITCKTISFILDMYPAVSAEWLMRGKGEMLLSNEAGNSTSSDSISEDDIRMLRERIISLEAENKVLREIAGLHQGERSHEGKIA